MQPLIPFKKRLESIIEARLDDSTLTVVELAAEMHLSRSQLYRKTILATGKSVSGYIRCVRLRHGKRLLETSAMTVQEIAYQVGFTDPGYFAKKFRKCFGYAPSERKQR